MRAQVCEREREKWKDTSSHTISLHSAGEGGASTSTFTELEGERGSEDEVNERERKYAHEMYSSTRLVTD